MKNIFKHGGLVRFGHFDSNPNQSENGSIYYNNSLNLFKVYENNSWENLATRKYADSIAAGFDPKASVKCATTENIAFGMLSVIDMYSLQDGDRVLVKNQWDPSENGIYVYSGLDGSLARASDFNDSTEVNGGEFVFVEHGDTWATTGWVVTSHPAIIGTDSINWSQVQGQAKSLNQAYAVGNVITTSSISGAVIIEGEQKLLITAADGLDVANEISVSNGLITTSSGLLSTSELTVASGYLTVDSDGDLTHIRGVPYNFPMGQASFSNAALTNDGSGGLSWARLTIDGLSDVSLTGGSASTGELLRYNGSDWVNEAPVDSLVSVGGGSGAEILTITAELPFANAISTPYPKRAVLFTPASGGMPEQVIFSAYSYQVSVDGSNVIKAKIYTVVDSSTPDAGVLLASSEDVTITSSNLQPDTPTTFAFNFSTAASLSAETPYFLVLEFISGPSTSISFSGAHTDTGYLYTAGNQNQWSMNQYWSLAYTLTLGSSGNTIVSSNRIIKTNGSGFLDQSFLQYNVDFGGNILSGVALPSAASDAVNKVHLDNELATISSNLDALELSLGSDINALRNETSAALVTLESKVDALVIDDLVDVTISGVSSGQLLRFDGSVWVNEAPVAIAGGADKIIKTNASGLLDTSFLQYNIDFGGNRLSGVAAPTDASDVANRSYVDSLASSLTLHGIYKQDTNGSDAIITTDSEDGSLIIAGDQSFVVSASQGIKLAVEGDPTKYVQMLYKDSLLLTANTSAVIPDLCFDKAKHSGLQATYILRDQLSDGVRVGQLFVATETSDASVADTYTETQELSITWSAEVVAGIVQVSYTTDSGNKIMNAKLELMP